MNALDQPLLIEVFYFSLDFLMVVMILFFTANVVGILSVLSRELLLWYFEIRLDQKNRITQNKEQLNHDN